MQNMKQGLHALSYQLLSDYMMTWQTWSLTRGHHVSIPNSFHFVDVIVVDDGVEGGVEVIQEVNNLGVVS